MLAVERCVGLTTMTFHAKGIDPISKTSNGTTALMLAAASGDVSTVQALLSAKASVNDQREDGHTALFAAAEHGSVEIVQLLIANGANVELKDGRGETALASAARRHTAQLITAMRDA